jgi:hypothetical protein
MDFFDSIEKTVKKEKKEKKPKKSKADDAAMDALGIDAFGGAAELDTKHEKKQKKVKSDAAAKPVWTGESAPAEPEPEAPAKTGAYVPPSKGKMDKVNKYSAAMASAPPSTTSFRTPTPRVVRQSSPSPLQLHLPSRLNLPSTARAP